MCWSPEAKLWHNHQTMTKLPEDWRLIFLASQFGSLGLNKGLEWFIQMSSELNKFNDRTKALPVRKKEERAFKFDSIDSIGKRNPESFKPHDCRCQTEKKIIMDGKPWFSLTSGGYVNKLPFDVGDEGLKTSPSRLRKKTKRKEVRVQDCSMLRLLPKHRALQLVQFLSVFIQPHVKCILIPKCLPFRGAFTHSRVVHFPLPTPT